MKQITTDEMLAAARQMNEDLAKCGYMESEIIRSARVLGRRIYQTQPHWHTFRGECSNGLPFEIEMQALALLTSVWVTDIYLRKARDRKIPEMSQRYWDFHRFLFLCMKDTQTDVDTHRDEDAEKDYQRYQRPPTLKRKIQCRLKRLRWGH